MAINRVKSNGNHLCITCNQMIWTKDEHYLDSETHKRSHIVCPALPKAESQDEEYKRFLTSLWRSYRFNYTQWETDFIIKNKDRDIEEYPYTADQVEAIEKLMRKFLRRM